jgi:hypothetical protein
VQNAWLCAFSVSGSFTFRFTHTPSWSWTMRMTETPCCPGQGVSLDVAVPGKLPATVRVQEGLVAGGLGYGESRSGRPKRGKTSGVRKAEMAAMRAPRSDSTSRAAGSQLSCCGSSL